MNVSTYYYKPQPRAYGKDDAIVTEIHDILELIAESGYRPVTKVLKRTQTINHKRVQRIMRENRLLCCKTRHFRLERLTLGIDIGNIRTLQRT